MSKKIRIAQGPRLTSIGCRERLQHNTMPVQNSKFQRCFLALLFTIRNKAPLARRSPASPRNSLSPSPGEISSPMISKFYRRLLLIAMMAVSCLIMAFLHTLTKEISDHVLDFHSITLHQGSAFNPRSISYCIYAYIHSISKPVATLVPRQEGVKQIGNEEGIFFHWDDWVDLSPGDSMLDRYRVLYPDGKCDESIRKYASVNPYWIEFYQTKVLRDMANLYCVKDIPKRILAATDEGFVEIPVLGKKRMGPAAMPKPNRISKFSVVLEMEQCNSVTSTTASGTLGVIPYQQMQQEVDVDPQDFIFDPASEIVTLKEKLNSHDILTDELKYLQFLEHANLIVDTADRFFKYPWIYTDVVAGRSHHTSFPFFKRFISNRERLSTLHHMVRVWFRFAEANGAVSWVNHGSLLGWTYNGMNMPWDTDVDIQMPIAHLDKLSRKLNSTIIMENPRDGNAKYLFEVSPTYISQGNGRNFIDARFIDINSGLYIDISAVAHTKDEPPDGLFDANHDTSMAVHCKHWQWSTLEELLPLRHTFLEGGSVYIPHNVTSMLLREYGKDSYTKKFHFNDHHYRSDLQIWVPDRECPPHSRARQSIVPKLTVCKTPWMEDEYKIVHAGAQRHKELNVSPDENIDYDLAELKDLPLARKDAWDYFNDINNKAVRTTDWYIEPAH